MKKLAGSGDRGLSWRLSWGDHGRPARRRIAPKEDIKHTPAGNRRGSMLARPFIEPGLRPSAKAQMPEGDESLAQMLLTVLVDLAVRRPDLIEA
ncbi:MAG TPA: hypothetical protein VH684_26830 [Xanthobacteraceae bacterium]